MACLPRVWVGQQQQQQQKQHVYPSARAAAACTVHFFQWMGAPPPPPPCHGPFCARVVMRQGDTRAGGVVGFSWARARGVAYASIHAGVAAPPLCSVPLPLDPPPRLLPPTHATQPQRHKDHPVRCRSPSLLRFPRAQPHHSSSRQCVVSDDWGGDRRLWGGAGAGASPVPFLCHFRLPTHARGHLDGVPTARGVSGALGSPA